MKHLTSVSATNLKGRNFQHPLAPFTLVTGPNATGKTAVTDAVTIALTGLLPKLGKRNSDTFRLASGQRMTVGLSFSDGQTIERSWTESKGSVKSESSDATALDGYLLDANEYFQLSDRERMKLVFAIAPGLQDAVTVERVVADIKRIKLDDHTEHAEKVLTECAKIVADEHALATREGRTTQEWLDAAVAGLKGKLTEANASLKRMSGTAAGIAELGRDSVLFSDRELKAARDRQSAALRSHEAAVQNHRRAMADSGRKLELESKATGLERAVGDRSAAVEQLAALRSKAAGYNSQTATLTEALRAAERMADEHRAAVSRREAWASRVADLEKQVNHALDYDRRVNDLTEQIDALDRQVADYRSRTPQLKADRTATAGTIRSKVNEQAAFEKEAADLERKRDELLEGTCCPTCHENGDHWRSRIADEYDDAIRHKTSAAADCRIVRQKAEHDLRTVEASLEQSVKDDATNDQQRQSLGELRRKLDAAKEDASGYRTLCARLTELRSSAPPVPTPFTETTDAARTTLNESRFADTQHAELLKAIGVAEQSVADYQRRAEQVASIKGELSALVPEDADTMAGLVATAKQALDEAASAVDRLQREQREADAAKAEQLARLKAVEALHRAEAEVAATKLAVTTVEDVQRELVAKAFNGLLTVANRIAGPVLRSPLEYRDGEIGRFDGRHWITQRTFSGTEQAVTYAAFAVALAARSELRLCVVDEIGRLDRASRAKLFTAVRSALADGTIGQFIGIMPELDDRTPDGATVIVTK